MGKRLQSQIRVWAQQVSVTTLALSLAFTPAAQAAQGTAQNNAGGTNSLAQGLSTAMGVVSMGLGGLYMAKGAQQLSCCSSGCTGNGSQSKAAEAGLDKQANKWAAEIKVPTDWGSTTIKPDPVPAKFKLDMNLRFPDGASNCPQVPARGPFSLLHFFQPPKAHAMSGCLDAMIALATGGLMLLQGIMSLNAANQAGKNADTAFGNSTNMGSFGTSPTPDSKAKTNIGQGGRSGDIVKIDPSLLRTGKANDIMGQFEDKFGMSREAFANALANGEDPRKLLGNAPRNALSNADMNKATDAAKGMSDEDKAKAMAELSDTQKEMSAKLGINEMSLAAGSSVRAPSSSKKPDEELDSLGLDGATAGADAQALGVSPEVQAALDQRASRERAANIGELTLFQIVHTKYREKSKIIFGYDPDGQLKGVGNANGL